MMIIVINYHKIYLILWLCGQNQSFFSGSAEFLDPYPWREIMSWFVTCPDMITLTGFDPCRFRSVTSESHTLEIPQTVFIHKLYGPKK